MTPCILHSGGVDRHGYGRRMVNGVRWLAHRLAWVEANGPIPDGLFVLHRCDNPPCINVRHLFLGTHADNVADMVAKGRQRSGKQPPTHCIHGHEFTADNTYTRPGDGHRECRTCRAARR